MEPTTNSASGKIITALIIGLLVGFAMGVFWQDRRAGAGERKDTLTTIGKESTDMLTISTTTPTKAATGSTPEVSRKVADTVLPVSNTLIVKDQEAGSKVLIESVEAKEALWVAVREVKEGKPGNILGASKVFAGKGENVSVELLRPTVAGGTYRIVIYRDVGALDFNYKEDVLVEGVVATFKVK